jgi:hypothetical protein
VQEIQSEIRKEHKKQRKLKIWQPAKTIFKLSTKLPEIIQPQSYTGYAFAQEEGAATALQFSLQSYQQKEERRYI